MSIAVFSFERVMNYRTLARVPTGTKVHPAGAKRRQMACDIVEFWRGRHSAQDMGTRASVADAQHDLASRGALFQ